MPRYQYEKLEHIRNVPLFARLSDRQLRKVAKHVDEVEVPAGHVFSRQDRPGGEQLLIVVDGKLRVERGSTMLATVGPGEVVGEMSLLDGKPYSATVTADADSTLLVIGRRSFRGLLDDLPTMKDNILLVLVARLREVDARLIC